MTSYAYQEWLTTRRQALEEIAAAHRAVGGSGPGRRRATEQINHAYVVLLSSQFQGYCRDLHTEAVSSLSVHLPADLREVVRIRMVAGRLLDRGNPTPGNLGADFGRLGFDLWAVVRRHDRRNRTRQENLQTLAAWRNAIAHQDFSSPRLRPGRLRLEHVRRWRGSCHALARVFDEAVAVQLRSVVGSRPW
jgi:hypothetical protein